MLIKVYTQIKRSETCVSLYYYGFFPSLLFWRGGAEGIKPFY